jgi:hypothetical protein
MDKNKEIIELAFKAILRIHSNSAQQFCEWCNSYQNEFWCRIYNENGIFDDNLKRYLNTLNEQATLTTFINKLLNEKINDNQKREPEFVKLKSAFYQVNNEQPDKIYAFVITGTNKRVKSAIGNRLFSKLVPPNHHDEHSSGWRPFLYGKDFEYNIKQILDEFRDSYGWEQIDVTFLDSNLDDKQIVIIDKFKQNVIAFVDLLALDSENEKVARLFDCSELLAVFTPISLALTPPLLSYMDKKNGEIFSKLNARYSIMKCQLLQRSSEKNGMMQILKFLLETKFGSNNIIAGLDGWPNGDVRNIKLQNLI